MMKLIKSTKKLNKKSDSSITNKNLQCGDITGFSESKSWEVFNSFVISSLTHTLGKRVTLRTFTYILDKCIIPNVCT